MSPREQAVNAFVLFLVTITPPLGLLVSAWVALQVAKLRKTQQEIEGKLNNATEDIRTVRDRSNRGRKTDTDTSDGEVQKM